MNVTFYYNASDKNKINKSLNSPYSMSGSLRDVSNVVNPTILVNTRNLISYNYCYIKEFKRYYFIDEITAVRNNLWSVSLTVDVLESFKDYFMNINCIIDKTADDEKSNKMLNDGSFDTTEKTFNEIIKFQYRIGESDPMFLLTVF